MKTLLLLFIFIFLSIQYSFCQAEAINLGQAELVYPYAESTNIFSPKNHPGITERTQLVWQSGDYIYIWCNDYLSYVDQSCSFWVYHIPSKQWKYLQRIEEEPNYGQKGVFSSSNTPGRRSYSNTFTDAAGNLYLMGGYDGWDENNDLWKYDIALNQWAWISGYNTENFDLDGNEGPIGIESTEYFPSLRIYASPVVAPDGMVYIYGGHAPGHNSYEDSYDLWRYNPANNAWTLLYKPSDDTQQIGQLGVENSTNRPGILIGYTSWYYNNSLWYFGGCWEMITGTDNYEKKVWKYNLQTHQWACMKNPASVDAIYGQQMVGDINNTPPYLIFMSNSVVYNNEAYFIGGNEPGGTTGSDLRGLHNSLWKYNMITNEWIWVKGKQYTWHPGFYGKMGIERNENLPYSRESFFIWLEDNYLKMYGGSYERVSSMEFWDFNLLTNNYAWVDGITTKTETYYLEDITVPSVYNQVMPSTLSWGENGSKLWFIRPSGSIFHAYSTTGGMYEYDIATSTCHKIIDNPSPQTYIGFYGTKGVADPSNIPPTRSNALLWETGNKLYLMGGNSNSYKFNDFWEFDKSTKMWTWLNGAQYNETPYSFYSAIGVSSAQNYPRSRAKSQSWSDSEGNLWLFSGGNDEGYYLNDFWKYDVVSGNWILMGGGAQNCTGTQAYFTDSYPPYVISASTWSHGNDLYLYGGEGLGKAGSLLWTGILSDVWKYSITDSTWSKIAGTRKIKNFGNYGTRLYGFESNIPGYRSRYVHWCDDYGNLWIYGGSGVGEEGTTEANLYDLWKFDVSLNLWIWMDGLKNPQSWTADFFRAKDYNLPQRVSESSVTYKGNGKYYLATVFENRLWEFDFGYYQKDYNVIEGYSWFDMTGQCDTADAAVPGLILKINGEASGRFYTNQQGYYKLYTPFTQNTVEAVGLAVNNELFNISPTTATVNFTGFNNTISQDFCLTPDGNLNDCGISLIPLSPSRPGFDNTYKIVCRNYGNTLLSGSVKFLYNEDINDYISASEIPALINPGLLEWNYSDLSPFGTKEITVTLNLNSPLEVPPVNSGDLLHFTGKITPLENDNDTTNNTFNLNLTAVNSFDPNDKTCLQGKTISQDMAGKYVTYLIRFENTGTSVAQNIVVTDTIDQFKFEPESIITIDASHPYRQLLMDGNRLEYHFDNILLPNSPDESRHGFVVFSIRLKPGLYAGDTFSNSSSIYFDYNLPVATNSYVTTVHPLGLEDTEISRGITIFPNPVKGVISFQSNEKVLKAEVYDLAGRIICSIPVNDSKADLQKIKSGTYLIKSFTGKGFFYTKIVKE